MKAINNYLTTIIILKTFCRSEHLCPILYLLKHKHTVEIYFIWPFKRLNGFGVKLPLCLTTFTLSTIAIRSPRSPQQFTYGKWINLQPGQPMSVEGNWVVSPQEGADGTLTYIVSLLAIIIGFSAQPPAIQTYGIITSPVRTYIKLSWNITPI